MKKFTKKFADTVYRRGGGKGRDEVGDDGRYTKGFRDVTGSIYRSSLGRNAEYVYGIRSRFLMAASVSGTRGNPPDENHRISMTFPAGSVGRTRNARGPSGGERRGSSAAETASRSEQEVRGTEKHRVDRVGEEREREDGRCVFAGRWG